MEGNSFDFIYFLEIVKERSSASPGAHGFFQDFGIFAASTAIGTHSGDLSRDVAVFLLWFIQVKAMQ
jgi:hypothetical protein